MGVEIQKKLDVLDTSAVLADIRKDASQGKTALTEMQRALDEQFGCVLEELQKESGQGKTEFAELQRKLDVLNTSKVLGAVQDLAEQLDIVANAVKEDAGKDKDVGLSAMHTEMIQN